MKSKSYWYLKTIQVDELNIQKGTWLAKVIFKLLNMA